MKPYFFVISKKQFHEHHPDRDRWPGFTLNLPASLHYVVNACQKLDPTPENYMILHNLLKALSFVEIEMDRKMTEKERG